MQIHAPNPRQITPWRYAIYKIVLKLRALHQIVHKSYIVTLSRCWKRRTDQIRFPEDQGERSW